MFGTWNRRSYFLWGSYKQTCVPEWSSVASRRALRNPLLWGFWNRWSGAASLAVFQLPSSPPVSKSLPHEPSILDILGSLFFFSSESWQSREIKRHRENSIVLGSNMENSNGAEAAGLWVSPGELAFATATTNPQPHFWLYPPSVTTASLNSRPHGPSLPFTRRHCEPAAY